MLPSFVNMHTTSHPTVSDGKRGMTETLESAVNSSNLLLLTSCRGPDFPASDKTPLPAPPLFFVAVLFRSASGLE